MRRRGGESPGLTKAFMMLKDGVPHTQIIDELEARETNAKTAREKGEKSELNVKQALKELYYVKDVLWIGHKDSNHDHNSHDLQVWLDAISCLSILSIGLKIPNKSVFVEVKSSDGFIDLYKEGRIKSMGLSGEDEFWKLMRKNKIILLNGQKPKEDIQDEFKNQLVCVNEAWAERNF